jgi:hypothetical protein
MGFAQNETIGLSAQSLQLSPKVDGSITTAKVADGAVTRAKMSDDTILRTYAPIQAKAQYGSVPFSTTICDTISIIFAQPFAQLPVVIINQNEGSAGYGNYLVYDVRTDGFQVSKGGACATLGWVNWIAIGN